jgi:hypothetical protein
VGIHSYVNYAIVFHRSGGEDVRFREYWVALSLIFLNLRIGDYRLRKKLLSVCMTNRRGIMDLSELGECTDSEYSEEHCCNANKFPKFDRLVRCISKHEKKQDSWQLHGIHYADDTEVEMGEAEYIGEITYHSVIQVDFCPFCGENLNEK